MITKVTEMKKKDDHDAEIGSLYYGTLVTNVEQHPLEKYIKVRPKTGQGIDLSFPSSSSLLFNIKSAGLRIVSQDTIVKVLEGTLETMPVPAYTYQRE